jgi:PRTRC genetic system protein B
MTTNATYFGAEEFTPKFCFITYSSGSKSLLMQHEINNDGAIGAGVPASIPALGAALAACMPQRQLGYLPEAVLYADHDMVIWWRPAGRHTVFVSANNSADTKPLEVDHPPLVFVAKGGTLAVFALLENKRPLPDTVLMHAPYPNVYETGAICMGNARLPMQPTPQNIHDYEKAFMDSRFTHLTGARTEDRYKGGLDVLWQRWCKPTTKRSRINPERLVPHRGSTYRQHVLSDLFTTEAAR